MREPTATGPRTARRAVVFVLAALCIVWFAAIARSLHEQAAIRDALHSHPVVSAPLARALDARVDQAAVLNPDRQIPMLKALIAYSAHRPASAVAIARRVTAQEPDNIDNWVTLELLLNGRYPALEREARARIHALAPPVPPAP